MVIFVVSDTHMRVDNFLNAIKSLEKPDLVIHLGDNIQDAIKIEKDMNVKTVMLRGNCDYYTKDCPEEKILNINGKKILATHGHRYDVKYTMSKLLYAAKEKDIDVVLFGHTHVPLITRDDGIVFMNPGSPTFPRLVYKKTFGILNIEEEVSGKIIEIK